MYWIRIISKISDEILKGNISTALVLLNQIIDKGFDGQHFVIGLGEHLRSLMISRDEATIDLMDTSNNIKEKYRQQAPQFETGFLIKCLEINNQSDINYRMSNNKRLLLELSLMQMCGLASGLFDKTGAEKKRFDLKKNDVPESLLTDKQYFTITHLSPIPKSLVSSAENKAAVGTQKTEEKPIESATTQVEKPREKAPTSPSNPPPSEKPKSLKRKINRGFSRDLGYSLNDEKKAAEAEEDPVAYMIGNEQIAEPVKKEQLDKIISAFINDLEGQPSLKSVLRSEKPVLINDKEVEFKFYNKAQEQDLMSHAEVLLMKLRTQLNNYQIKIKTTILATENFKAEGPMEKFEQMAEKNPNLRKLKDVLNLEIEF